MSGARSFGVVPGMVGRGGAPGPPFLWSLQNCGLIVVLEVLMSGQLSLSRFTSPLVKDKVVLGRGSNLGSHREELSDFV